MSKDLLGDPIAPHLDTARAFWRKAGAPDELVGDHKTIASRAWNPPATQITNGVWPGGEALRSITDPFFQTMFNELWWQP